ncbi:Mov34/MPN/PAD-1 family protein, partial [Lichenihabitans sp. Uapishka_5]|uniref:Mov34/MPN/PAD-1 family protein n=1 Tax=Lichenihabitans sp. Uapishka_5 TaxID=3037302 RepID=UPI0029E7EBFC
PGTVMASSATPRQGTRSGTLTFPMPDSRLSTFAAGLAEAVHRRLISREASLPGHIDLGHILSDGLSQIWQSVDIDPMIAFAVGDRHVRVSARVDVLIRERIAARPGVETGGVIVGRYVQASETFQVVDLIEAPPDSIFTAERFTLGTQGLRPAIARLMREAGGSLHVLGTWHNHLMPSGPSRLDAATAARLALRQFYPALMLIAHPEGYSALISEVAELAGQ